MPVMDKASTIFDFYLLYKSVHVWSQRNQHNSVHLPQEIYTIEELLGAFKMERMSKAAGPQGICQTRVKHRGQQLKLIVESGLAPMSLGNSPVCCLGF